MLSYTHIKSPSFKKYNMTFPYDKINANNFITNSVESDQIKRT